MNTATEAGPAVQVAVSPAIMESIENIGKAGKQPIKRETPEQSVDHAAKVLDGLTKPYAELRESMIEAWKPVEQLLETGKPWKASKMAWQLVAEFTTKAAPLYLQKAEQLVYKMSIDPLGFYTHDVSRLRPQLERARLASEAGKLKATIDIARDVIGMSYGVINSPQAKRHIDDMASRKAQRRFGGTRR